MGWARGHLLIINKLLEQGEVLLFHNLSMSMWSYMTYHSALSSKSLRTNKRTSAVFLPLFELELWHLNLSIHISVHGFHIYSDILRNPTCKRLEEGFYSIPFILALTDFSRVSGDPIICLLALDLGRFKVCSSCHSSQYYLFIISN